VSDRLTDTPDPNTDSTDTPTQDQDTQDDTHNSSSSSVPSSMGQNAPRITCAICHASLREVSQAHLGLHGFTLTRYRRAFPGAPTRAPRPPRGTRTPRAAAPAPTAPSTPALPSGSSAPADDPTDARTPPALGRTNALNIAQRIIEDPDVIRSLADEVSEAIFSSSLRERLRFALVGTIARRLEAHGTAVARLDQVRAELTQDWRVHQGGPNGTPTPTKDLASIHNALAMEVKHGEELVLKAVKAAIDEAKGLDDEKKGADGMLDAGRFTGTAPGLRIPAELSSGERETIRTLMGMLTKAVDGQRALTVAAQVRDVMPPAAPVSGSSVPPHDPVADAESEAASI
jgi:hypothetical protein